MTPRDPSPTSPSTAPAWTRADGIALALLLLAALALRGFLAARSSGLTMDSPLYVRMAEDLLAAHRDPSPAHHGYPLLVALASLAIPGRELPGRAVSLVASLVLVALVWIVARRHAPRSCTLVPALGVAVHPLLAVYGSAVMTESVFLALAFGGIALLDARRARSGGALLGAAWWVRPEAVVVAPLAVLLAPLRGRERWLALVVALAVALPYTLVLRAERGYWSLTPKSALVRAPFRDARSAEWRLADSTAFADTVGVGTRLARDGGAILRAYPARLLAHGRNLLEAWPIGLLLFSFAGLAAREARGPWLAFAALPLAYPLLSAPADPRFAQLALPALALPLLGCVPARIVPRQRVRAALAWVPVAMLPFLWSGPMAERALAFDDGPVAAMRGAGVWLAANSGPDAVVMDRKSFVAFFAGRRHVQLPDEPLDTLLEYARASGATHLVVEEYVTRHLRPQLAPLLDPVAGASETRVRLAFVTRPAPGEGVAVFEVVR
jgi:hypothetical protein